MAEVDETTKLLKAIKDLLGQHASSIEVGAGESGPIPEGMATGIRSSSRAITNLLKDMNRLEEVLNFTETPKETSIKGLISSVGKDHNNYLVYKGKDSKKSLYVEYLTQALHFIVKSYRIGYRDAQGPLVATYAQNEDKLELRFVLAKNPTNTGSIFSIFAGKLLEKAGLKYETEQNGLIVGIYFNKS